jgi:hypothetical protein
MYRPFRPTVITGHTRLISGHMMAEAYQAIVAFRHVHTFKDDGLLGHASEQANAIANTLRIELVKK